ncbi:hypothetical protein BSNK01_08260 [Bacillaceae bacterium]
MFSCIAKIDCCGAAHSPSKNTIKKRQLSDGLGHPTWETRKTWRKRRSFSLSMNRNSWGPPLYIDGGVTFGKMA